MRAIANRIEISSADGTLALVFGNDSIESIQEETALSLIGDELFVDQFTPVLRYLPQLRGIFKPKSHDTFQSADRLILCPYYNTSGSDVQGDPQLSTTYSDYIRLLPYGTKVTYYCDGSIYGVYYIESVERKGRELYQLNCISAVGLMTMQQHKGNVYFNTPFSTVVQEILGDEYNGKYTISQEVQAIRVLGWLPYSTKRKNLHQLLLAYGVSLSRNAQGNMHFTFIKDQDTVYDIPKSRTYINGSVSYSECASRVELTEHSYSKQSTVPDETLFDNSKDSEAADNTLVSFGYPVDVSTLSTEGGLTLHTHGVNFAYVSGNGILTGKPYAHGTRKMVSDNNAHAVNERIVTLEEATLVTLNNSDYMLARLREYYFNANEIKSSIVAENEHCGGRYQLYNIYNERVNGYMRRKSMSVTSLKKAECDFITDYTPQAVGSAYSNIVIFADGNGTWNIPSAVREKAEQFIRVVLIGKGETGADGADGENGNSGAAGTRGEGGAGGIGGVGGAGGKVNCVTIDCTNLTSIAYTLKNGNAFLEDVSITAGGVSYSSASGTSRLYGFYEPFQGKTYALPGIDGQAGAKGGDSALYDSGMDEETMKPSECGETCVYKGVSYVGGAGGNWRMIPLEESEILSILYMSGGGGGGAAVGRDGGDAYYDYSHGSPDWMDNYSKGGDGATPIDAQLPTTSTLGTGGTGGHGGGGGGGGGTVTGYNYETGSRNETLSGKFGIGGAGGKGSEGQHGGILIYY